MRDLEIVFWINTIEVNSFFELTIKITIFWKAL
uniref:Uncharacterized protein n=1 Tax=Pseudomonas aeruginosa TaxID=287 RepID=A6N5R3_PSEAI|nr:hypothetical protein [Pseudomonas aeruginosa]